MRLPNRASLCLTHLLLVFTLGCGSGLESNSLRDGETLKVGETRILALPINYSYVRCNLDPSATCTQEMDVYVTLPDGVTYAGEPETRVQLSDLIFGEEQLDEPDVAICDNGATVLQFSFQQFQITNSDDDSTILDGIQNSALESFVIKVKGDQFGDGGEVHYLQDADQSAMVQCQAGTLGSRVMNLLVK